MGNILVKGCFAIRVKYFLAKIFSIRVKYFCGWDSGIGPQEKKFQFGLAFLSA